VRGGRERSTPKFPLEPKPRYRKRRFRYVGVVPDGQDLCVIAVRGEVEAGRVNIGHGGALGAIGTRLARFDSADPIFLSVAGDQLEAIILCSARPIANAAICFAVLSCCLSRPAMMTNRPARFCSQAAASESCGGRTCQ